MTLDLDALESHARAATPGPWRSWSDPDRIDAVSVCYTRDGSTCEWCLALAGETDASGEWTPETLARWQSDARYIAAVSPDVVLALIARVRELEASLGRYGVHLGDCARWSPGDRALSDRVACTCGLDTALRGSGR